MCDAVGLCQDVQDLINGVLAKLLIDPPTKIMYDLASNHGEAHVCQLIHVTIKWIRKRYDTFELFVKHCDNITSSNTIPFGRCFANEIYFYEVIRPTFTNFLCEKKQQPCFLNSLVSYGISKTAIALESIRKKSCRRLDARQCMDESHIAFVLTVLAQFHATSFALKDQRRQAYDDLVKNVSNTHSYQDVNRCGQFIKNQINDFLASLDPIEDKHLLDGCGDLAENLISFSKDSMNVDSEYSVLIHGDCWHNNLFFWYRAGNNNNIIFYITLIDWQMIRSTLPVYDLLFFFYLSADKEALDKLDYFLNIYHNKLTQEIRGLGSDPEILYPFAVLEKQWKEHAKYGFSMAFLRLLLILKEKNEVVNFEDVDLESTRSLPKIKNHSEYVRRLKILAEHFIKNDFL